MYDALTPTSLDMRIDIRRSLPPGIYSDLHAVQEVPDREGHPLHHRSDSRWFHCLPDHLCAVPSHSWRTCLPLLTMAWSIDQYPQEIEAGLAAKGVLDEVLFTVSGPAGIFGNYAAPGASIGQIFLNEFSCVSCSLHYGSTLCSFSSS